MPSPYDDVQRRPSAPQRVVVHRRQVVVDERVGVDELEAQAAGQRPRSQRVGGVRAGASRATASAAASVRIGRSRLPPAKTL